MKTIIYYRPSGVIQQVLNNAGEDPPVDVAGTAWLAFEGAVDVAGMIVDTSTLSLKAGSVDDRTSVEVASDVRVQRDALLATTDWRVMRAAEGGVAISKAWKDYRQALRDVTSQPGFPHSVVWPEAPAA